MEVIDLTNPASKSLATQYPDYEMVVMASFTDSKDDFATFYLIKNKSVQKADVMFMLKIATSKGGKQKVYIVAEEEQCSEMAPDYSESFVLKVSNQNVKFRAYCHKDNELYLYAQTGQGESFMLDQLLSKKFVRIDVNDLPVIFKTDGFKNAWDSFGGDAL